MNYRVLNLIAAAFVFFSAQSQAAFSTTDWKTGGDGKSLLDTDTGLEWLRGNETAGKTIAQVENLLATTYAGWRLPKASEVEVFMNNFFSSAFNLKQTYYSWSGVNPEVSDFSQKMGYAHLASGQYRSYFLYRNDTCSSDGMDCILMSGTYLRNSPGNSAIFEDFDENYTENFNNGYFSVFLVSDGGTTLSSINNPGLNINNPKAPVNNPPAAVSAPIMFGGIISSLLLLAGVRRRA